jgi:hypothetical protein
MKSGAIIIPVTMPPKEVKGTEECIKTIPIRDRGSKSGRVEYHVFVSGDSGGAKQVLQKLKNLKKKDPDIRILEHVSLQCGNSHRADFTRSRNCFVRDSLASFPLPFRKTGAAFRVFPGSIQSGHYLGFFLQVLNMKWEIKDRYRPGLSYER